MKGFRRKHADFGDYISDGLTTPAEVQSLLQGLGYDVRATGTMDFETMAALMSFKNSKGLPPNFDVDEPVMRALVDAQGETEGTDVGSGPTIDVNVKRAPPWWLFVAVGAAILWNNRRRPATRQLSGHSRRRR